MSLALPMVALQPCSHGVPRCLCAWLGPLQPAEDGVSPAWCWAPGRQSTHNPKTHEFEGVKYALKLISACSFPRCHQCNFVFPTARETITVRT